MKTAVHQYEDKLLEFAYGELPRPEAEAVEAHVRNCVRCSESLGQIRSVRASMSHLPLQTAPETGLESLLAYAEQTARRNAAGAPRKKWWRSVVFSLASAATLLVVGVVAYRANETFNPDPVAIALNLQHEKDEAAKKSAEGLAQAKEPGAPQTAAVPRPVDAPKADFAAAEKRPEAKEAPRENALDSAQAERKTEAQEQRKSGEWTGYRDTNERGGKRVALDEAANAAPKKAEEAAFAEDTSGLKQAAPTPKEKIQQEPADVKTADDELSRAFGADTAKAQPSKVVRGSLSKREAKPLAKSSPPPADWSNAAQRGALRPDNDGTGVSQAMEGNAVGGTLSGRGDGPGGPALGLSTGNLGTSGTRGQGSLSGGTSPAAQPQAAAPQRKPVAEDKKMVQPEAPAAGTEIVTTKEPGKAKKKGAKDEYAQYTRPEPEPTAAAPQESPAPPPPPATKAPAINAPSVASKQDSAPRQKSSLGVSLGSAPSGSSMRQRQSADLEDQIVSEGESSTIDRGAVTRDAEFNRRKRIEDLDSKLKLARGASSAGDRMLEAKICLEVLNSGAEGYQRVEALKRLCDAFESVGEADRAQPFCDTLVKEFRNTAAARLVMDRRQKQLAPAKAKSRYEFSADQVDEKNREEKAAPKPTKASEPAQTQH